MNLSREEVAVIRSLAGRHGGVASSTGALLYRAATQLEAALSGTQRDCGSAYCDPWKHVPPCPYTDQATMEHAEMAAPTAPLAAKKRGLLTADFRAGAIAAAVGAYQKHRSRPSEAVAAAADVVDGMVRGAVKLTLYEVHMLRADVGTSEGHMRLDRVHALLTGDEVCPGGCPERAEENTPTGTRVFLKERSS